MALSYKPLWRLFIEKDMNKGDLVKATDVTHNIVVIMGKNAYVDFKSIEKI